MDVGRPPRPRPTPPSASPVSPSGSPPPPLSRCPPPAVATLWQSLALGGTACGLSAVATHPLDVIKTRMQTTAARGSGDRSAASAVTAAAARARGLGHSPAFALSGVHGVPPPPPLLRATAWRVIAGGAPALYAGLGAALARAATYSAVRVGGYERARGAIAAHTGLPESAGVVKVVAGATAGAAGALVGAPFELAKTRMQAAPPGAYRHLGDALLRAADGPGGVIGLWRGGVPAVARAAAVNAAQLGVYDSTKGWLRIAGGWGPGGGGWGLEVAAAAVSGVVTTTVSSPADVLKTRMMVEGGGRGLASIALGLLRTEGAQGLFRGWTAAYLRLGPQTALALCLYERLRQLAGFEGL
ncbi:hypothetical protein MMPV_008980 [Pyropia vietnamensis]